MNEIKTKNAFGKNESPLMIRCKNCGAPVAFDIIKQNHYCLSCGAETSPTEGIAEREQWQSTQQMKVSAQADLVGDVFYTCGGCGATVLVSNGKAIGSCNFCGGKLVRRAYTQKDQLPTLLVPFFITHKEAEELVKKWCIENSKHPEAEKIHKNINRLKGYYLPFQLVKGETHAKIKRENCFREYKSTSYIDGIAINTSKKMNNILLDAAEPFDFEKAVPFDFQYLEGYDVKLQDVNKNELESRVSGEVQQDFSESLKKIFNTREVSIYAKPGELLIMSTALPFYYVKCKKTELVVNGQTGRVAVSKIKVKKSYRYLLEPTLITIGIFIGIMILFGLFSDDSFSENIKYSSMYTLVLGIITFVAYTQNRIANYYEDPVLRSNAVTASRSATGKLNISPSTKEKKRVEPVFYEQLKSGIKPVSLRFYTKWSIMQWILRLILLNLGPLIGGAVLSGFAWERMEPGFIGMWLILSVPITLAIFLQQGRILIYDHPILYKYPYNGKEVPRREYTGKRDFHLWDMFTRANVIKNISTKSPGCLIVALLGFIAMMFIMSMIFIAGIWTDV